MNAGWLGAGWTCAVRGSDRDRGLALRLHANLNASEVFGISTRTIVGRLGVFWLLNMAFGFAVTRKRRRRTAGR